MFVVLPRVDVILGAMMMSSVCLVPCLLRWTTSPGGRNQQLMNKIENTRMLSGLLLGAQLLTIIGWTVIGYMQIGSPYFIAWIPLALILSECLFSLNQSKSLFFLFHHSSSITGMVGKLPEA